MVADKFWNVVKKFNSLMKSSIEGPNCLNICNGDCCSIRIDVPKILAEEYISRGFANKDDFIRSDVFSFKLRFDEKTAKCFLFNNNKCRVHNSGIKPPQCWIYPTNFENKENKIISCKKADGWKIIDPIKTKDAEQLLQYFIFLSQIEAKEEIKKFRRRLNNSLEKGILKESLNKTAPSQLGGFRDVWNQLSLLSAEGISLQVKKFCEKYNKNCILDYLECGSICDEVSAGLIEFLQKHLFEYVKNSNPDCDGEYPLYKLVEAIEKVP
ncbi:MAG: hypothetical protein ACXACO_19630 [Promethearchaeota archaeon]